MPSSPDFERAHQLNPDKFPKDPTKKLQQMEAMLHFLAGELAAKTKSTMQEWLDKAAQAAGSTKAALPQREEKVTEKGAAAQVEKDRALFFAHRERSTFYPIELRHSEQFDGIEESNILYFQNEDEAEANGFTAAEPTAGNDGETDDEDEAEAKDTKKPSTKTASKKK